MFRRILLSYLLLSLSSLLAQNDSIIVKGIVQERLNGKLQPLSNVLYVMLNCNTFNAYTQVDSMGNYKLSIARRNLNDSFFEVYATQYLPDSFKVKPNSKKPYYFESNGYKFLINNDIVYLQNIWVDRPTDQQEPLRFFYKLNSLGMYTDTLRRSIDSSLAMIKSTLSKYPKLILGFNVYITKKESKKIAYKRVAKLKSMLRQIGVDTNRILVNFNEIQIIDCPAKSLPDKYCLGRITVVSISN